VPSVDYVVVVNLLPQDATKTEKAFVLDVAHESRQTILQSADDAQRLVKPGKPGSKVVVWDAERRPGDIVAYLGVPVELKRLNPGPPPSTTIWGLHMRSGGPCRDSDFECVRIAGLKAEADDGKSAGDGGSACHGGRSGSKHRRPTVCRFVGPKRQAGRVL